MELAKALRPITKDEAIASYESLVNLDCSIHPGAKRHGLKALDYFFLQHRLKAETKRHISFYDAMRDPKRVALLNSLVKRWRKTYKSDQQHLVARYEAFQLYYGTINQFRPALAKWLYCQLRPRVGILDFSAGWGGRALAAMSLNIPYIGVDANTKLTNAYKQMIATYAPTANVQLFFQPSETMDFSRFKYDLIFTSPPYFMLEKYETMPAYKGKSDFIERFLQPVVLNAWKYLRSGGKMALNMPAEMYEAIKDVLPPLHTTIKMALPSRHSVGARQGTTDIAKNKTPNVELIYVWHKQKNQTRKSKSKDSKDSKDKRRYTKKSL